MSSIFSQRLKNAIHIKGVTQAYVAVSAQTSEANVSRYANDQNHPDILDILPRIAASLGVSTDYLLGLTDIYLQKADLTPDEQILISCYRKASNDDMEVLWSLFKKYMTPSERGFFTQLEQSDKIG